MSPLHIVSPMVVGAGGVIKFSAVAVKILSDKSESVVKLTLKSIL